MTDYGPLPDQHTRASYATAQNTRSVRHGYEDGGYLRWPDLYTADQMRAYAAQAVAAERERWAAVCDANASSKRALYAKTESDDDRGAAEMAEWLAGCIRGA